MPAASPTGASRIYGLAGDSGVGDAAGIGALGALHRQVGGQGHGVRWPSPCVIVPVPPQSLQQAGAGCGAGAVSVAIVARAAEIEAAARADSRPRSAGSPDSQVRT
jgi:hypothetical protein